jgi:hypothetical protein
VQAFDTKWASSDRFKVSYVEAGNLPPLTQIPRMFSGRAEALDLDERLVKTGADAKELANVRRESLRDLYFPIRITDVKTGNIYEVQMDRRTIIARARDGKELWRVNPFVDAKLKPYRVDYPFINYFGRITGPVQPDMEKRFLQVNFNSSQYGRIDLKDGSFTMLGQD